MPIRIHPRLRVFPDRIDFRPVSAYAGSSKPYGNPIQPGAGAARAGSHRTWLVRFGSRRARSRPALRGTTHCVGVRRPAEELETLLAEGLASAEMTEDEFWKSIDTRTNDMLVEYRLRGH